MVTFDEPHHDGSELYVPAGPVRLGDEVPVRVRVPNSTPHRAVWLRSVEDGEPRFVPCRPIARWEDRHGGSGPGGSESDDDGPGCLPPGDAALGTLETWFEGRLLISGPVTNYRFALTGAGGRDLAWLTAAGLNHHEPTDAFDFRITIHPQAPSWIADGVIYQIFPDRFARSAGAGARQPPSWAEPMAWGAEPAARGERPGQQFYGGDLAGIEEHLDDLQRLGVTTLYLTPIFPAGSSHRYDANSFHEVDPLLGGDDALTALSAAVHARGMRIVGDLTTNHTGRDHAWFERASRGDRPVEAGYYLWHSYPDDPVTWMGVRTLPKLDWSSAELREAFVVGEDSVVGRWLRPPFSLDGWRIDVANMTGRHRDQDLTHEVARLLRREMTAINPEAALVAEHMFDASADLAGDGWQSTMNYAAFTFPIWSWLRDPEHEVEYVDLPVPVPRRAGDDVVRTMREFAARVPWQVAAAQWNNLGSHDTARLRSYTGSADRAKVAVALLMTYLGVPMLYAGDEWGLTGTTGEHGRVPMPWDEPERRDEEMWRACRELIELRGRWAALRHGSLRWVLIEDDAIGYVREDREATLLVVAARAAWPGVRLPRLVPGGGVTRTLCGAAELVPDGEELVVPGTSGPEARIWRLR